MDFSVVFDIILFLYGRRVLLRLVFLTQISFIIVNKRFLVDLFDKSLIFCFKFGIFVFVNIYISWQTVAYVCLGG